MLCRRNRRELTMLIMLVLILIVGCCNRSASDNASQSSDQPAQATSSEDALTAKRTSTMDVVQLLEVPTREGLRLQYRSEVLAFNLSGDAALTPITPHQVLEYYLEECQRGFVVVDELTNDAIVIIYDASAGGKQTFALDSGNGNPQAKGWLLRGQSGEPVRQAEVHQFLATPQDSRRAFGLKGNVVVDQKDGYVQRMSFQDVATQTHVPADDSQLRSRMEFWEHQLEQLTQQAKANPDDELLAWGVQQAEDNFHRFQRLVRTGTKAPMHLSNGQIVAEWVRAKPLWRIELP